MIAVECLLTFEAAHRNTSANATETTRRLHGHSYEVLVSVAGAIDPAIGWVMDFAEIKDHAMEVINHLDHYTLNDIAGMTDTTLPDVTRWIESRLRPLLPELAYSRARLRDGVGWHPSITREMDRAEWLTFGFEAAHFLPHLPDSHKCRRVHGHSFRVKVKAGDMLRLGDHLALLYPSLDHRLLNDIDGLNNPTSELLAQWLANRLSSARAKVHEIVVAETCTSSCRLTLRC